MSDRLLGGAVAAVGAAVTLMQLVWMFGMFSPAAAVAGHNGAGYAMLLAAWFFVTLSPLAAIAIILLMTENDARA
jgi:hypothetical protein